MFKMEVNVLITSVSRKVWLVKAFKDALRHEGIDGKVISADINSLSAALYVSDKYYIVPRSDDPKFIPKILEICKDENIKLIIPTSDKELLLFAENKKLFEDKGIKVVVSQPEVIETCRDKYKFYRFLREKNILTPETYTLKDIDVNSLEFPLFIKPRFGSGSSNINKINNEKEFSFFVDYIKEPVIQEFIVGKEYTVDVFSDFEGNLISITPRERIEIVSGESYKGRTIGDKEIIAQTKKLIKQLRTIGHVTVQCIKKDNDIYFIEINPRFGGGAALGFAAGSNTPQLLIKLIIGKKVESQIGKFKENLIMLRYTEDIFIDAHKNNI